MVFGGFILAARVIRKLKYDEGDVRKRIKTGNAKERSFSLVPRIHKERKKHEQKDRSLALLLPD
jgi:putative heme iron utilization protein